MTNNISFREAIDAYRKDEIDKYAIKYGRNIIKWIYNVLRVCAIQEGFNDITGFLLDAEGRAALIKKNAGQYKCKKSCFKNEVWRLYRNGLNRSEIAARIGVSGLFVGYTLKTTKPDAHVPFPGEPTTKETQGINLDEVWLSVATHEEIWSCVTDEHKTLADISEELGVKERLVRDALFTTDGFLYIVNELHFTPRLIADMTGVPYYVISERIQNLNNKGAGIKHRPDDESLVNIFGTVNSINDLADIFHVERTTMSSWLKEASERGFAGQINIIRRLQQMNRSAKTTAYPGAEEFIAARRVMTLQEMAEQYGVNTRTIKLWACKVREEGYAEELDSITKNRVGVRKDSWAAFDNRKRLSDEEIVSMLNDKGMSVAEIAEATGYSMNGVYAKKNKVGNHKTVRRNR